jgi:hypothetical protein
MGTKSVTSFNGRAMGLVDAPGGYAIDRAARGSRQSRRQGPHLVFIASGDDDDSAVPDLEVAIFDAP